jgi:hypothetical protein
MATGDTRCPDCGGWNGSHLPMCDYLTGRLNDSRGRSPIKIQGQEVYDLQAEVASLRRQLAEAVGRHSQYVEDIKEALALKDDAFKMLKAELAEAKFNLAKANSNCDTAITNQLDKARAAGRRGALEGLRGWILKDMPDEGFDYPYDNLVLEEIDRRLAEGGGGSCT